MTLIEPVQRDEALLADITSTADRSQEGLRAWWLGQAGFVIQWRGRHAVLDPYLSDSLTAKYAATDKPHVRMTARAVDPSMLRHVEVVTSSHNHTDHLDHETLWPLLAANPDASLVVPDANRAFVVERLRTDPAWPVGLVHGASVTVGGFRLTGVAVAHETLEVDALGRHHHLGYLIEAGPWTLFHSGDAVPYDGMEAEVVRLACGRAIDVAFLPINGRLAQRRVPGNFWGDEAARFANAIGARLVVPMHFEMFAFNTETPELFAATAASLGQPYRVLRCGESLNLQSGEEPR